MRKKFKRERVLIALILKKSKDVQASVYHWFTRIKTDSKQVKRVMRTAVI